MTQPLAAISNLTSDEALSFLLYHNDEKVSRAASIIEEYIEGIEEENVRLLEEKSEEYLTLEREHSLLWEEYRTLKKKMLNKDKKG